jgi:hypothetical protein
MPPNFLRRCESRGAPPTSAVSYESKPIMSQRHKMILAVSPDHQLASFRHLVLRDAGFEVVSVHTESAARFEIHFGRCGVLLLCHKLSRAARESLAEYFVERCPEPYIVAVLGHSNDHFPPETHKCILHSLDPAPLVNALEEKLAA